jgi:hypothetical protein
MAAKNGVAGAGRLTTRGLATEARGGQQRDEADGKGKVQMKSLCSVGVGPSWLIWRWSGGRAGGFKKLLKRNRQISQAQMCTRRQVPKVPATSATPATAQKALTCSAIREIACLAVPLRL